MKSIDMKRRVIIVAAATVLALFFAAQAGALDTLSYGVNQNGQTYGSAFNPATKQPNTVEPDLRAVQASNGKRGYVYTEELNGVLDGLRSMSDEEYRSLHEAQAQELMKASEEVLGFEALSKQGALEYLSDSKIAEKMAEAEANACDELAVSLAAKISADPSMLYSLANLEERGIVEASGMKLADEVSAAAEGGAGEPKTLPAVTVPESTMYEIANRARQATAIQLTVYESDGETPVGTIPFNLM